MHLNASGKVMGVQQVSKGGTSVSIDSKTVLQSAIKCNTSSIILCHNHPGSVAIPSEADVNMATKISHAADCCCVLLWDNIIITNEDYFSFREQSKK